MPFKLPKPDVLEQRSRMITLVETLIEPEFDTRYFEFYESWGKNTRVARMRSGEGDHYVIWFSNAGTVMRGMVKGRKAVPIDKLFKGLPKALNEARDEAAFKVGADSFAMWWPKGATHWAYAVEPDKGGAQDLLFGLDGKAKTFARWLKAYHDVRVIERGLDKFFSGGPVSAKALGIDADEETASELAKRLGFKGPAVKGKGKKVRDDGDTAGDAEFKIIELAGVTKLIVGGKVQLYSSEPGLYMKILEDTRQTLRGE